MSTLSGSCYCGVTKYSLDLRSPTGTSSPSADSSETPQGTSNVTLSSYCHCSSCSRLNGAPFIHTVHIKEHAVRFLDGAEPNRWEMPSKPGKFKLSCKECRSPLGTWNEGKKRWSIWPVTLSRDTESLAVLALEDEELLKPTAHMYLGSWSHPVAWAIEDGLPRWSGEPGKSEQLEVKKEA